MLLPIKRLPFLAILIVAAVLLWTTLTYQPVAIPVFFSEIFLPYVSVKIGERTYPCDLYLTGKYPLWMTKETSEEVIKERKGEASWKDINGKEHQGPLFEIPSLYLGPLNLKRFPMSIQAQEENNSRGAITWPFDKTNILLDFPHHKVWGVRDVHSLKKLGLDIGKMEKIKCNISEKDIYFKADTSIGELTLSLSTSANLNIIDKGFGKDANDRYYFKTRLGSQSFGENQFVPYPIPPELEIDGMLGVNFLLNHVVYVDARDKYLCRATITLAA